MPSARKMPTDHDIAEAYHEAGHAAAVLKAGLPFLAGGVSIRNHGEGGLTSYSAGALRTRAEAERSAEERYRTVEPKLTVDFAGARAEIRRTGREGAAQEGARDDQETALAWMVGVVRPDSERQLKEMLLRADAAAQALVEEHWPEIVAIAERLLEADSLTGAEVAETWRSLGEAPLRAGIEDPRSTDAGHQPNAAAPPPQAAPGAKPSPGMEGGDRQGRCRRWLASFFSRPGEEGRGGGLEGDRRRHH